VIRPPGGARRAAAFLAARFAADEMEVLRIAAAVEFRRRGLARRLLRNALAEARAAGIRAAFLEVHAGNLPAVCLYEGLGFVPVGRRAGYYGANGEDALILTRTLHKEAG
jgi:ribosomal-protein-alanine N-acetyltransferase